jgi:hypothetical protein
MGAAHPGHDISALPADDACARRPYLAHTARQRVAQHRCGHLIVVKLQLALSGHERLDLDPDRLVLLEGAGRHAWEVEALGHCNTRVRLHPCALDAHARRRPGGARTCSAQRAYTPLATKHSRIAAARPRSISTSKRPMLELVRTSTNSRWAFSGRKDMAWMFVKQD